MLQGCGQRKNDLPNSKLAALRSLQGYRWMEPSTSCIANYTFTLDETSLVAGSEIHDNIVCVILESSEVRCDMPSSHMPSFAISKYFRFLKGKDGRKHDWKISPCRRRKFQKSCSLSSCCGKRSNYRCGSWLIMLAGIFIFTSPE